MLNPRIIPVLLVSNRGLYKTIRFKNPTYIGDPLNAVRIFNEKEVDELIVLDIQATRTETGPDYELITQLARESRMPLCYGGGIKSVSQIERLVGLGVEKVAISSAAISDPSLIQKASESVGSQSVVVVVDIKLNGFMRRAEVVSVNGTVGSGLAVADWISYIQELGVGEISLNFVDRDGTMDGYDLDFFASIYPLIHCPCTIIGGAGSINDLSALFRRYGLVGAGVGSLFVYKGRFRAVLINYPDPVTKGKLFADVGFA